MDELNYMKQLVREFFDLYETSFDDRDEMFAAFNRIDEIEKELKELSGYAD